MDLRAYLDRIGFDGVARPDLATLKAVHRRHLLAIPYENLDVQLGRPLTTSPAAAFEKIVGRSRGGWCYEMNGVLGSALEAIGFEVTRLAGGVARAILGDAIVGNHLVLRVELDRRPWLADVGFGDGPIEPFPIVEGAFESGDFAYDLSRQPDGWWRLTNHPRGGAPSFDFQEAAADEAVLGERCETLQTSPASPFVQNLVVQKYAPGGLSILRGRTLRTLTRTETTDHLIGSADELMTVLATRFGLDVPEAEGLWPAIAERHEALFGAGGS